jgi:glycerate 2-kinase
MGGPARIRNLEALAGHGQADLRRRALGIAEAGLAACDAHRAALEAVALTDAGIAVAGREFPLAEGARVVVVGAGKASLAIATALHERLGDRIDAGLVAVPPTQSAPPTRARSQLSGTIQVKCERAPGDGGSQGRIEVVVADHPLPSERSVAAGEGLLALAQPLGPDDLVLACFTGGSSALASAPPAGVSIADKRALTELLLASGMSIAQINTVRKHVSRLKGGRLAAAAAPARLVNLTVSDVAGDVLDVFTGPSVQDTSTPADARAVLEDYGLWGRTPESIRHHLADPAAESPRLDPDLIHTEVLVSGHRACAAMIAAAGEGAVQLSTSLEGEARELGRMLGNLARGSATEGAPFAPPVVLVGCGGEAAVTLGPDAEFGAGGPNGEAALAAALELDGAPVAALMIDTDGSDGSTDWAGALVDGHTAARARALDLDLRAALLSHRSSDPLATLGDLIDTGPTGTNVNDLFVLVVEAVG